MGTTIDLIRQAGPVEWLLTPFVLASGFVLLALVLSGLPGRILIEVESLAAARRMQQR